MLQVPFAYVTHEVVGLLEFDPRFYPIGREVFQKCISVAFLVFLDVVLLELCPVDCCAVYPEHSHIVSCVAFGPFLGIWDVSIFCVVVSSRFVFKFSIATSEHCISILVFKKNPNLLLKKSSIKKSSKLYPCKMHQGSAF